MISRYRVVGQLDSAGGATTGTVMIDRATGLFMVRPYRRKRLYTLPLADVATMVCRKITIAEVAEKRRQRAKRKGGRR